jgi:hypothetical protein
MSNDPNQPDALNITDPTSLPPATFTCIVYVSHNQDGTVAAHAANLAGVSTRAATERDALANVARKFKSLVTRILENGETVPWIEPPDPPKQHERIRSIPLHL